MHGDDLARRCRWSRGCKAKSITVAALFLLLPALAAAQDATRSLVVSALEPHRNQGCLLGPGADRGPPGAVR